LKIAAETLRCARPHGIAARDCVDASGQFGAPHRFRDAIVSAGAQAIDDIRLARLRRHQDDREVRHESAHPRDDLGAAHVARGDRRNQQIIRFAFEPRQEYERAVEEMAKVAVGRQSRTDQVGVLFVRVDNGDSHGLDAARRAE
jgi:hypothetical protein